MKIGYVRVSSTDQNPERQIEKMRQLGIEDRFLFVDKVSGKDFNRPRYQAMKAIIREGDELYVDSADRLGRNYEGMIAEWKEITRVIGADIIALDNDMFNSKKFREMGDIGKLLEDQVLSLLAWVAEQEREKIKKRQREGIDLAMAEGRYKGRPKVAVDMEVFEKFYPEWKAGEITARKFMQELGLKPNTFYRTVQSYEEAKSEE